MASIPPVHEMMQAAAMAVPVRPPYSEATCKGLSVGQEWVTPDRAKVLRQTCHYDRQRNLSVDHIRRLSAEMKNGWFLPGAPIWLCVMPDKTMLIVNGNHTLEAVVESAVSIPLTFIYQEVSTLEEVAAAYACFDIQRMRTWMQAAQAAGLAEEVPLAKNVLAALSHIIGDFDTHSRNPSLRSRPLRFGLMKEYTKAATMLSECLAGAPPSNTKYIRRGGVMAVSLVTMRYQPSNAESFWRDLVWDDGLRKDDPRKVLLRYLQQHDTVGAQATRQNILAASNAWNAAFEGRTIDHLKPTMTARLSIMGTPWAGGPTAKAPAKKGRVVTGRKLTGRGETEYVATYATE